MTGCGDSSSKDSSSKDSSSSINLEDYLPSDGYQKRRDGLFYQRNTQTLISGTILNEQEVPNRMYEGDNITYYTDYYQVKDGLLHGKSLLFIKHSDDLNKIRRAWGNPIADEPTLIQEINYRDGYVSGNVKYRSYAGDILVEGQVKDGKRIGDWRVFDGKELLTISFSNNDYSLPEGTELEDNVKEFLDRNWLNKINKFY